jgi:thiol-disulfide isomerase/thioredoxin
VQHQAGLKLSAVRSPRSARAAATAALILVFAASPGALSGDASRLAGELDAAGLKQAIASQKGRVVLVNFWATWCVPCREEFPELAKLQKRHGPEGLQLIGVSTDFAKQRPAVEKFLVEQRPPFPNYRKKGGGDDQIFIDAVDSSWGGELPFSVLYDRSGRKVRVFSGSLPIAAVDQEIRKLLAR